MAQVPSMAHLLRACKLRAEIIDRIEVIKVQSCFQWLRIQSSNHREWSSEPADLASCLPAPQVNSNKSHSIIICIFQSHGDTSIHQHIATRKHHHSNDEKSNLRLWSYCIWRYISFITLPLAELLHDSINCLKIKIENIKSLSIM